MQVSFNRRILFIYIISPPSHLFDWYALFCLGLGSKFYAVVSQSFFSLLIVLCVAAVVSLWACSSCPYEQHESIMKFSSQAKKAQLHSAHMQTFIIEQQAFIIHTTGFPYTQQKNFYESFHQTLNSLMLARRHIWIFSCAHLQWDKACLLNTFLKKCKFLLTKHNAGCIYLLTQYKVHYPSWSECYV